MEINRGLLDLATADVEISELIISTTNDELKIP